MRRACRRLGRATIERARWGGVNYASTPTTLVNFAALGVDFQCERRTAAIADVLRAVGKSTDDEVRLATDVFEAYVSTSSQLDLHGVPKRQSNLKR